MDHRGRGEGTQPPGATPVAGCMKFRGFVRGVFAGTATERRQQASVGQGCHRGIGEGRMPRTGLGLAQNALPHNLQGTVFDR